MSSIRNKRRNLLKVVGNILNSKSDSSDSNDDQLSPSFSLDTIPGHIPIPDNQDPNNEVDVNVHVSTTSSDTSDYSLESSISENDEEFENWTDNHDIVSDLRELFCSADVPLVFIKSILAVLKKYHPELPLDPRTLLQTNREVIQLRQVFPGKYFHFGLKNGIEKLMDYVILKLHSKISLFIDGLPLFNSSTVAFWPILASIDNYIFVVGIYYGLNKPSSVECYLADLITELKTLLSDGIQYQNRSINISLECISCDTPARAYVKCIKGHSGYFGCDRCNQKGLSQNNRLLFLSQDSELRTNETFREHVQPEHHHKPSPFEEIESIDMVSHFPNDYMHSVCKGIIPALLNVLKNGPKPYKLSSHLGNEISNSLKSLHSHIPSDFQRKPRGLNQLMIWKATESRLFGLYLAPAILAHSGVHDLYFQTFMCFTTLFRIISHHEWCVEHNDYAKVLAKTFLDQVSTLCGNDFVTYNSHSLIHLVNDCLTLGSIDNFSCFKFESFLHFLKKVIHTAKNPLQQAVNRISERTQFLTIPKAKIQNATDLKVSFIPRDPPPIEASDVVYFKKCITNVTCLRGNSPDGYTLTEDGKIMKVKYFAKSSDGIYCVGRLHELEVFTEFPSLTHWKVGYIGPKSRNQSILPLQSLVAKCMCLPTKKHKDMILPILHTYGYF